MKGKLGILNYVDIIYSVYEPIIFENFTLKSNHFSKRAIQTFKDWNVFKTSSLFERGGIWKRGH